MVAGLGLIATAYADNVNADGDTVASPDNINYNNNGGPNDRACNTRGSAVSGSARVAFGGSTHFAAGQTVTVAVTPSVSGAAAIAASGGTGTVPSPWGGGGDFTVAISTTVPATAADGTYSVTVSATSATHTANGDSFSVIVGCPAADTTDPDSPSVVIYDGASWTNDGSGSVSVDISAHDAVGVTRYRLATTQAGLDSAGDVAVSPAEVTFSRADLPFTLSAGEGAAKEVWARFCDAADNCADASDTIGWTRRLRRSRTPASSRERRA